MRHEQVDGRDALADDQRLTEYLRLVDIHRADMILPGGMKKNVLLVVEELERMRPALAKSEQRNVVLRASRPMVEVRMMQQVE